MKKLFSVGVKEVYVRAVQVRANSEFEAREMAKKLLDSALSTAESFYAHDLPSEEWPVEVLPEPAREMSLISNERSISPGEVTTQLILERDKKR